MKDESEQLKDLFSEVKKIYPNLQYLRKNNKTIEFGLMGMNNNIHWFSYCRLPVKAEEYINLWLKLGGLT